MPAWRGSHWIHETLVINVGIFAMQLLASTFWWDMLRHPQRSRPPESRMATDEICDNVVVCARLISLPPGRRSAALPMTPIATTTGRTGRRRNLTLYRRGLRYG
ncbi:hypothetical protein CABS01_09861 [Colletotrichum abscissum]|uniref:uncharacterized protein n=1 Tax=Colletotrichum abscissum TaxID=1671311 RepID=UPI0027D52DC6|nr:uncharacterized protein CABS01_09861 [Colletotrichum abscissum]KAK1501126.1 hypothetical protein CABS01_09861 [Colletotrichum abscissum]